MNIRTTRTLLVAAAAFGATACVDLEVTNPNNPDVNRALNSPSVVELLASSSINQWWLAATFYEGTMMMQVTADAATANFGNFGMRFNNEEPRIPYANTSSSGDEAAARVMYQSYYRALSAANDVILAIQNGLDYGSAGATARVESAARFAQAASLMGLSMQYDSGFAVTLPPTPAAVPQLVGYQVMRDSALLAWDRFIATVQAENVTWPGTWLPLYDIAGVDVPTDVLVRIGNTMAARTLVLNARTGAQNAATDWARVLTYADAGITGTGLTDMNFSIIDDGGFNWYDYIKLYGNLDSWTRVDQRLINRMVPTVPAPYTATGQPASVNTDRIDLRVADANPGGCGSTLTSCIASNGADEDYIYTRTVIGDPGRGIWMQSEFYHKRWRGTSFHFNGAARSGRENVHVLAAENDLMIAEALARTGGDLTRAAALVNKTRVTRGGLPAVAAVANDILAAVDYERDVELLNTSALSLFDARRFERIQVGTMRHLPIPARELEILSKPIYTYGGAAENPSGM